MLSATTQTKKNPEETRSRRRIMLPRLGEILLLALAGFCLVVLVTQDFGVVTRFLYSPLAIILLVVVFVEFLIIKGGDRSRLYRIELERMREREQEQVERMRKAVGELDQAFRICREQVGLADLEPTGDASAVAEIEEHLKRIDKFLRPDLKE